MGKSILIGNITGPAGKSAYQIAAEHGYEGTEAAFGDLLVRAANGNSPIDITITVDDLLRMTADKTYAELVAEIAAGKRTLKVNGELYIKLTAVGTDDEGKSELSFSTVDAIGTYFGFKVNSDDEWTWVSGELVSTLMLQAQDYANKQYVQDYVDEHGGEFNINELIEENNLIGSDEFAFYDQSAEAMRKIGFGVFAIRMQEKLDPRYVAISQGAAHAGEILVVGEDGKITTMSLSALTGAQ